MGTGGRLNWFIRYETLHTFLQYYSFWKAGIPYMAVGRNLAASKAIFLRAQDHPAWSKLPSGDDAHANAVAVELDARRDHPRLRGAFDERLVAEIAGRKRPAPRNVHGDTEVLRGFAENRVEAASPALARHAVPLFGSLEAGNIAWSILNRRHRRQEHDVFGARLGAERRERERNRQSARQ